MAGFPRGGAKSAKKIRRKNPPVQVADFRGEGGVICGLIELDNGWMFSAQFNMKVDSDVLLLFYLDKICLILTGELWRGMLI